MSLTCGCDFIASVKLVLTSSLSLQVLEVSVFVNFKGITCAFAIDLGLVFFVLALSM